MATTSKQKTEKVPEIRFSGFPNKWNYTVLSEMLVESKKRNLDLRFGKDKVLSVSGESGIVNQIEHLGRSYAGVSVHNYHVVDVGNIVYTKSPLKENPYGIIKLNKGKEGIVSTLYAVYKVKDERASGSFLDHYFSLDANTNRYLRPLVKKGAKNDMKINNSYVLHDGIFIPTINEQRKVAQFLDSVDAWIANLRTQSKSLEQYKKGVMQKIFTQKLRFKDDNGKEYSKWTKMSLSDIGDTYNGLTGKTANDFGEGVPFITYKQIFDNTQIDVSKCALVNINKDENQNRAQFGDVFFTTSSETPLEVGYSSVLLDEHASPYLNSFSFGFRPKSLKKLDPLFSKFFFRSSPFRKEVIILAQGSTRYNISKTEFMKILVTIPSLAEQNKISVFLNDIDMAIESKKQQIANAKKWKKALIQSMFI